MTQQSKETITDGWYSAPKYDEVGKAIRKYGHDIYQPGRGTVSSESSDVSRPDVTHNLSTNTSDDSGRSGLGTIATSAEAFSSVPATPDGWDTTPEPDPVSDAITAQKATLQRAGSFPVTDGHTAVNPITQG